MNRFTRIHLLTSDLLGEFDRLSQSDRKRLLSAGATNLGPLLKNVRTLFVAAGRVGGAVDKKPEPELEQKAERPAAPEPSTAPEPLKIDPSDLQDIAKV